MSRYADIEWLKTEFDEANEICFFYLNADSRGAFEELKKIVEQAPNIEIICCEECKHWAQAPKTDKGWCDRLDGLLEPTWYCADGERSE